MKETETTQKPQKPAEIAQFQELVRKLRTSAWLFVRQIQGTEFSEQYMNSLAEVFANAEDSIRGLAKNHLRDMRFSRLTEEEKDYLRQMLNTTNN